MIRSITISLLFFAFFSGHFSFAQNSDFIMDERDGNIYLIAKFNATWWMCQNLKYNTSEGSACYEDDETNCMLKGRLYSQEAAVEACPEGYHLPSDEEWKELESYIGMDKDELDKKFNRNTGTVGRFLRMGGGLSFDADYIGMVNPKGNSSHAGGRAYFWTSSEDDNGFGWIRIIEKTKDGVERQAYDKNNKLTVRCVKAGVADPATEAEAAPATKTEEEKVQPKQRDPGERKQGERKQGERNPEDRKQKQGKKGKEKIPD